MWVAVGTHVVVVPVAKPSGSAMTSCILRRQPFVL